MTQEKYVECPIYHKDVLFTDSKKNNIGQSICMADGLYCSGVECIGLKLEPPEPKRQDRDLSFIQRFGKTIDFIEGLEDD